MKLKNDKERSLPACKDCIAPGYDMRRDGITQSMICNFLCCRKRGFFAINRWVKAVPNVNTFFGSVFHEVLDKAYTLGEIPLKKDISRWIDELFSRRKDSLITGTELDERVAATVITMSELYFDFYKKDFTQKKFTKTEEVVDVKFNGYRLLSKIDGHFRAKDKTIWLMEHKTKGRIDEDKLVAHLTIDFQNLFYQLLFSIKYKIEAKGTLYNVIRTPGLKDNGNMADFQKRLAHDVKLRPSHYFKRWQANYSKRDREIFSIELLHKLTFIEDLISGKQPTFKNEWACELPFTCTFIDACTSGKMTMFKQTKGLFEELKF